MPVDMNNLAASTDAELRAALDVRATVALDTSQDTNTRAMAASDHHMIADELAHRAAAQAVADAVEPAPPAPAPDPNEGWKDDADKDRFDLIPAEAMFALARVLTLGARKYADRNWEKGFAYGRAFGALMRHMWAWWGGRTATRTNFLLGDLDDEWKCSHLWHALCCLVFLVSFEERRIGTDDRPVNPSR
ncbi:MAG: DUF5664 domain-containing protein [Devosia sp.]|nr:DUF5664 domain-containing protein [Devosia sp.]